MHTGRRAQIRQSFKFLIAGTLNVVLTLIIFLILLVVLGLHYVAASLITWVAGITINFAFMWFWVFKQENLNSALQTYKRHFVFHAVYYVLNLGLLILITENTEAHPLAVQVILLVFLLPINFFGTKYLVMNLNLLKKLLAR